ncbi:SGT1-like protein [Vairimorpha necatrix]|uniref:SGT1-like protein n=1 Tax=Vairimorpha necatrix TaxID=6039 RepID=A0AAX4JCG8_9MICR
MDFAETKSFVILFSYDLSLDTTKINLIDKRSLFISPSQTIKLYREVTHIQAIKINRKSIEIILIKETPFKWYSLQGPEKIKETRQNKEEEEEEEENNDIIHVLSRIYENGDENTRRAMEKSLIESKGTELSTNWEDKK